MKKALIVGGVGAVTTAAAPIYGLSKITTTEDQDPGGVMKDGLVAGGIGLGLVAGTAYGAKKGYNYLTEDGFKNSKALGKSAAKLGASMVDMSVSAASTAGRVAMNVTAGVGKTVNDLFLEHDDKSLVNRKLNKTGKKIMAAVAIGASVLGIGDAYDQSRSGKNYDQDFVTNTPDFEDKNNPSLDNYWSRSAEAYGAGGDLVFALNRNRRG